MFRTRLTQSVSQSSPTAAAPNHTPFAPIEHVNKERITTIMENDEKGRENKSEKERERARVKQVEMS